MSADPKSTYYDHGGVQVIDIIRAKLTSEQFQGYLLGNVLKYAARLNWKGASVRDAEKLSLYAMWLHEELAPPPAERQEQVRERHDIVPEAARSDEWSDGTPGDWYDPPRRPPDRPLASHCPDGGACRHKCGLEPCKGQS